MKILNIIKKLISGLQKKKSLPIRIHRYQINEWFSNFLEQKRKKFDTEYDIFSRELQTHYNKLNEDLNILAIAELKNSNLPKKVIDIMQGNREFYIKKVKDFSETVKEITNKKNSSIDDIKKGIENFKKSLDDMATVTQKSYFVMQEFFRIESREIAIDIKSCDSCIKKISKLIDESKFNEIEELKNLLQKTQILSSESVVVEKKISEIINQLKSLEKEYSDEMIKKENILKSSEYIIYKEMLAKKNELEEKLKKIKLTFNHKFSVIEKLLIKFARMTNDEQKESLIEKYLTEPSTALLEDENMKIIDAINDAKTLLLKGDIDLKDKKKEKTITELSSLTKESLTMYLHEIKKFYLEISELDSQLIKLGINEKLKNIEDNSQQKTQAISDVQVRFRQLETEKESLDPKKHLKKIEIKLSDICEQEVIIE